MHCDNIECDYCPFGPTDERFPDCAVQLEDHIHDAASRIESMIMARMEDWESDG